MNSPNIPADLLPVISEKAIAKSGRVLKAFSLLYLPFHGLEPADLFEFYGPIAFVSASVYQADELNEDQRQEIPSLNGLREFLRRSGFLDRRISNHLKDGEKYLNYERSCRASGPVSVQNVIDAMAWRSADFRILHCLLYKFLSKTYEGDVFSAFAAFEMMMEVDDDIASYSHDRRANTFNFVGALFSLRTDVNAFLETFRASLRVSLVEGKKSLAPQAARRFQNMLQTYAKLVPRVELPALEK